MRAQLRWCGDTITIMASPFECEVRYEIEDIGALEERLGELEARVIVPYEFTDHYFKPVGGAWNLAERNLRIREWKTPARPTTIFFVKTEIVSIGDIRFKRALYSDGKVPLYSAEYDICRSLLGDMGFEPWFDVAKTNSTLWEIPKHDFITAVEFIEGLNWIGELEFEGEDPERAGRRIEEALGILGIPADRVSHKPISQIYAEEMGIV